MGADIIPAAGHRWLAPVYDQGVRALTREGVWRAALVGQVAPAVGDLIVDVGCGTGTLLVLLGKAAPGATLVGLDPDPTIIPRARAKLADAGIEATLVQGFPEDLPSLLDRKPATKVVSSLVFHHIPLDEKRSALAAMLAALSPEGELHLADYGLQRSWVMRSLFRVIQALDGFETTEPNARGVLPGLIREVGFEDVEETLALPTPTGSISLYRARRGR